MTIAGGPRHGRQPPGFGKASARRVATTCATLSTTPVRSAARNCWGQGQPEHWAYYGGVKRYVRDVAACLLLGIVTTVAVAWGCAAWVRYQHWVPIASGVTSRDGPGWALKRYEGPGFSFAQGWPIENIEQFFGPRFYNEVAEYPSSWPPVIEPTGWLDPYTDPPNSQVDHNSLVAVDVRGWPRPALWRVLRQDLSAEIESLSERTVHQGGTVWPMSEYDWWHMWRERQRRRYLLADAALPIRPFWPGLFVDVSIYRFTWLILFLLAGAFRATTRGWTIPSRAAVLTACLCFGMVVTVSVAWRCAAWMKVDPGTNLLDQQRGSGKGPTGWELWQVYRTEAPGLARIESRYSVNWTGNLLLSKEPAEGLIPWWADEFIQLGDQDHHVILCGSGWPTHALWWWSDLGTHQQPGRGIQDGIALSSHTSMTGRPSIALRALPFRPIWFGVIADTLFHGSAGLCVFVLVRSARMTIGWRRRRCGCCPACGYILRGNLEHGCPECGWRRDEHTNRSGTIGI